MASEITAREVLAIVTDELDTMSDQQPLTRHRMEQSWNEIFPIVEPTSINLNEGTPILGWVPTKSKELVMTEIFEKATTINFLSSLQQCLGVKAVYDDVIKNFASNSLEPAATYKDIWDGQHVKSNPVFVSQKGAVLGIQLYFDEVELCNPLGSKKGKHKVGVFYWTFMNLRPEYRSKLRLINLLAIVGSNMFKKYGYEPILAGFLKDMEKLKGGIELVIGNERKRWYAILLNVVGDMPASNSMGGFKESVGAAVSPCRICEIQRSPKNGPLWNSIHHEIDCTLRNKESHRPTLARLAVEGLSVADRKWLSKTTGVNGPSCLSVLSYIDETKIFVHDLMHLLYEGVVNLELAHMLRKLISDYALDLDNLNSCIKHIRSDRELSSPPAIRSNELLELKKSK